MDEPAKPYEDLPEVPSDNEFLYYMHYRLGAANTLLGQIRTLLTFILITLAVIASAIWFGAP